MGGSLKRIESTSKATLNCEVEVKVEVMYCEALHCEVMILRRMIRFNQANAPKGAHFKTKVYGTSWYARNHQRSAYVQGG